MRRSARLDGTPSYISDTSQLAMLLQATARLAEGKPMMRKSLEINLHFVMIGYRHPNLHRSIQNYSILLEHMGWRNRSFAALRAFGLTIDDGVSGTSKSI